MQGKQLSAPLPSRAAAASRLRKRVRGLTRAASRRRVVARRSRRELTNVGAGYFAAALEVGYSVTCGIGIAALNHEDVTVVSRRARARR